MSILLSLCLAATPVAAPEPSLLAPAPLAVTQVVREGLPPYEDDNRLYRLEGEGCDQLQAGRILLLFRRRARLALPRLQVVEVRPKYALARVAGPGQGFPLRGDLAFPQGALQALPDLPALGPVDAWPGGQEGPPPETLAAVPGPEPGFAPRREPLYFRQGETRLSPAGQAKLKEWVRAWGTGHRWSLACPPWPGESLDLSAARLAVLKEECRRLGIKGIEETILSEEPPGRLPLIYVAADPW